MLGQLIILVTAFAATVSATPQMPELPEWLVPLLYETQLD